MEFFYIDDLEEEQTNYHYHHAKDNYASVFSDSTFSFSISSKFSSSIFVKLKLFCKGSSLKSPVNSLKFILDGSQSGKIILRQSERKKL
jgi:hypothetical protein